MTGTHTVVVVLTFAVAPVKAKEVLERWWSFKERRKRYMRDRRAGRVVKRAELAVVK